MAKNATAVYGGHEFEFVNEVPDRFNCQICTKVLRDPHLAVCCGQHFCESCLNKWFDRQQGKQSCPHCRAEGEEFNHVIHKGLRSEISQLKIRCSHHKEGCQWTGELGALKGHLESKSGCGFVVVECPNRCKTITYHGVNITVMQRKLLNDHLNHRCYLRPHRCEFCGLKDTYEAITGFGYLHGIHVYALPHDNKYLGHQATCPNTPLTCPNKCGSKDIKRKNMHNHRSKCPRELVECPFAEAGCTNGVVRCQLEDHMTSNMQLHLMMVMKDNKETKTKLKETQGAFEKQLQETQAKLTETELKLNQIQVQLDETLKVIEPIDMHKLKKSGDSIKLQMRNFSEYRRSGKVWHSPPFYYREGYKMCLAVHANRVGKGSGAAGTYEQYFSVSLLLLRGKYDDQLKWPMKFCERSIHPPPSPPCGGQCTFLVCSNKVCGPIHLNEQKRLDYCDFFGLEIGGRRPRIYVVNDCFTLSVEWFDSCNIVVRAVSQN